ncbi:DUF3592 domain-containing protein [Fibrisoma montanum]|uniref:DUF3592 domain-containing protein n=1 Tax=Fibrisoma montanum TaxID=2305895 RepID=A0A418MBN0_9BACT|nr:DUF3592 domain-containing protein [Fibrisoma montanum]RIV23781.1 DUF3592 domain-containing protein [Fibrisoma montanum]
MKQNIGLAFFGLFALIGTIFLIVAYVSWQSSQRIIRTGIETKGVVIDNRYNIDRQGRTTSSMAPVVQFRTADGTPVTYYSQTYTSPPSFDIGQTITLWYLPDNPQEPVLEGIDGLLLPLIFGIMGTIFSLIGYWNIISALVRRRVQVS